MAEPALRADVRKSAASPRRITLKDRFSSYASHHREVARDSLLRMLRKPLGSLATWLVIGIALALPGGLYVAIDNLEKLRNLLFYDPESALVAEVMPLSLDDMRILQFLRAREATARVGWSPYFHNPKLPAHLHRVQCPTLLVWGRDDKLIPLAHGQEYAKLIPGARLEIIERCGHMLPYEKSDEFVRMATQFLQG